MKTKLIFLLPFISILNYGISQSSSPLDLKINTDLLNVDVFNDSLFSVDIYFDYSQAQNSDSISYEISMDGQIVESKSLEFQNGFEIRKIPGKQMGIIHIRQLNVARYNAVVRLYGNNIDVSDSKEFGY